MMDNTVSPTLEGIAQKLDTLSEDVKKIQKEDAEEISRKVSTGKTCPYRRAILWTAFSIALAIGVLIDTFIPYINFSYPLLLVYPCLSLVGEIIVYRLMKKKDSHKANAEAVQAKYGMTFDELDAYIRKLSNIRIVTVMMFFCGVIYSTQSLHVHILWIIYLTTTFTSIAVLRLRGKIKTPQRFFLFDLPKGNGEPLPKPSEPSEPCPSWTLPIGSNSYEWKYK
jgi:hypothetical protein